jgi:hypothetical protein
MESSSPSERKSQECDEVERPSFLEEPWICFSLVADRSGLKQAVAFGGGVLSSPTIRKRIHVGVGIYERRVGE